MVGFSKGSGDRMFPDVVEVLECKGNFAILASYPADIYVESLPLCRLGIHCLPLYR